MAGLINVRIKYPPDMGKEMRLLTRRLEDRKGHREALAKGLQDLLEGHLLIASRTRHKTAARLGARRTGYLVKMARGVEVVWGQSWLNVRLPTGDTREIFARVDGPVTIQPRSGKYLTIPANKASYGKRAREFGDLKFVMFGKSGPKALMKPGGKGKKGTVMFWLKERVTLPQDAGLLPTQAEMDERVAEATLDWIDFELLQLPES